MKLLVLLILYSCISFAGTSVSYIGKARIDNDLKISSFKKVKPGINRTVANLEIIEILKRFPDNKDSERWDGVLSVGRQYEAKLHLTEKPYPKKNEIVYFSCDWLCGKDGCKERKWTLLSEFDAKRMSQ